jgi:hypothetical protein
VQEFEVHLIRVRPDTGTTAQPVSKAFRSASGRFIWTALAEGTWHAAITAPGYQQFNLDKLDQRQWNAQARRTEATDVRLKRSTALFEM